LREKEKIGKTRGKSLAKKQKKRYHSIKEIVLGKIKKPDAKKGEL
jgi:hypothetical protein